MPYVYFCMDGLLCGSLITYVDRHQDLSELFTPEDPQHYEPEMQVINYMIVHNFHWFSQVQRTMKLPQILMVQFPSVISNMICEYSDEMTNNKFISADDTLDLMCETQNEERNGGY